MLNQSLLDLKSYTVSETIGFGRYGEVFKIVDKTGKEFAAKTLHKSMMSHDEQVKFLNEISILSKIQNPALLSFIGYSFIDFYGNPKPTIVTNYYPFTLSSLFCKNEIPLQKRYILLIGIAEGMLYLHSKGIVHRDLKPENILVDENYYPYICDFGQSKLSNIPLEEFEMKTVTGSLLYMAPEISKPPYTSKIDIYSYGIIAYQLITGTSVESINIVSKLDMTIIKNDQLKQLVTDCLSDNPNDRPNFSQILGFLKQKTIRDNFNIDDTEISKYLSLFSHMLEEIKKQADLGSIDSIIKYAQILKDGTLIPQNLDESLRYFKMAADKGNVKSMFEYAFILYNSDKALSAKDQIWEYFHKAIDGGDDIAMYTLGHILYQDKTIFKNDTEEGKRLIKMSANLGNFDALKFYLTITKDKNETEIANLFKICSNKGNPEAIETYASILEKGIGIEIDKSEAVKFYKLAADKGRISAMNNYAYMIQKGIGIESNITEAIRYYKMAINAGNIDAIINYANFLYYDDDNRETNKETIAHYYKLASDAGDTDSMINYSYFLKKGFGVEKNLQESNRLLKNAAEKENIKAMRLYATAIDNNEIENIDKSIAIEYYKKAGEKGDAISMRLYANKIKNNENVDINEVLNCYKIAADKGDIPSMLSYAQMKYDGNEILIDKNEASNYFKIAADNGNTEGMCKYANMCYKGDGIPINYEEAVKYYIKAIDLYDPKGKAGYAQALYDGKGVECNKLLSSQYFQFAADSGDIESMVKYAEMLYNGDGIKVDKLNASIYFKKAADIDNIDAMFKYAHMCFWGDGIQKNLNDAEFYYKKAADNNDVNSMLIYAEMKFHSISNEIVVDQAKAAHYYKKAADNGNFDAMFFYASIKFHGCNNVSIDKNEAAVYFKKAADFGHADSMRFYSSMLLLGNGIDKNYEKATHYACLSAQKRCAENDFPKVFKKEFDIISKGINDKLILPAKLIYSGIK